VFVYFASGDPHDMGSGDFKGLFSWWWE